MGTWKSKKGGRVSDEIADLLSGVFDEIGALPQGFSMKDLATNIQFVTRGYLKVEVIKEDCAIAAFKSIDSMEG